MGPEAADDCLGSGWDWSVGGVQLVPLEFYSSLSFSLLPRYLIDYYYKISFTILVPSIPHVAGNREEIQNKTTECS